jgi:GTPase SAR1 family protein
LRNADGAFIVYDITNKQSFKDVDYWLEQIKLSSNDDIVIYLLGNKKDLENNRIIDGKAGNSKAKAQKMNKFYEVSAKTKENLDKMFKEFYMEIYRKNKSKFIEKKNQNLKAFETFQKQENNDNGCC